MQLAARLEHLQLDCGAVPVRAASASRCGRVEFVDGLRILNGLVPVLIGGADNGAAWTPAPANLLGLDYEALTYRFSGRDMRLTDVHGRVIKEILA